MALKLLKFVLVAVAVLSLFDGTEQTCRGRSVPYQYREQELCTEPRSTSVQLQVPKGFAYVEPSFVRLKQCTGLSCGHRMHCAPEENSIEVHTFKVKAVHGNKRKCKEIEVKEHHACQCQCQDPNCPKNMVVERETCECVCDPVAEEVCQEQRDKKMWSKETCSCACNREHRSNCGSGEKFDEEECECVVDSNEEDSSEENYV